MSNQTLSKVGCYVIVVVVVGSSFARGYYSVSDYIRAQKGLDGNPINAGAQGFEDSVGASFFSANLSGYQSPTEREVRAAIDQEYYQNSSGYGWNMYF